MKFTRIRQILSPFLIFIIISVSILNLSTRTFASLRTSETSDSEFHSNEKQNEQILTKPKEPLLIHEEDTNHKVAVGREIKLKCVINDLGDHKVAWFHKDKRVLLAVDNKTVAWRDRVHVSSQANTIFFLQIDNVQLNDQGHISCQVNTLPTQSLVHKLDVVKSPQIKEQGTTVNIEPVKEFASVELRCVADGIPKPAIKWRRESQSHVIPANDEEPDDDTDASYTTSQTPEISKSNSNSIVHSGDILTSKPRSQVAALQKVESINEGDLQYVSLSNDHTTRHERAAHFAPDVSLDEVKQQETTRKVNSYTFDGQVGNRSSSSLEGNRLFIGEGEVLRFDRVSRYDMGFYMCIASNGVPPSVTQRIFLPVSFVPRPSPSTAESTVRSLGKTEEQADSVKALKQASDALAPGNTTNGNSTWTLAKARQPVNSSRSSKARKPTQLHQEHRKGKEILNHMTYE